MGLISRVSSRNYRVALSIFTLSLKSRKFEKKMPRKPTQSTQKSQKKKSKRSTQEPKFPLDFSDNTITAIIIPQVLPMLLNIPKNEITVDDFEKKLRFLIKTLLKNDLEDDIAGFDFEADRMPLDSLQNIIRAV